MPRIAELPEWHVDVLAITTARFQPTHCSLMTTNSSSTRVWKPLYFHYVGVPSRSVWTTGPSINLGLFVFSRFLPRAAH